MPYKDLMKRREYHKEYYSKNKKSLSINSKNYYIKNKEKIKKRSRIYRINNKEKLKLYFKDYSNNIKNKEHKREYDKKYKKSNRVRVRLGKYILNKKKSDIQFKLKIILRSRLLRALKKNYKSGSAVKDLGCTIEELKIYLEKQFKNGMSWNNHKRLGWHIDHKKPLSLFDLTNREQFLQAVNYTNLQPMWWDENIRKSNKINI